MDYFRRMFFFFFSSAEVEGMGLSSLEVDGVAAGGVTVSFFLFSTRGLGMGMAKNFSYPFTINSLGLKRKLWL
jgi:hypothetical protein